MEKYHWYLYLPDISLRKFNTTLVDEFEGRDLEFVTAQTITHLLNTFREIKSTQEKKLAVKMLIKAGLVGRVKAAV